MLCSVVGKRSHEGVELWATRTGTPSFREILVI